MAPSEAPPGWSYNPSAWGQRLPIVGLGAIGFLIATYLGLYQIRWIDGIWDPFFPEGSRRILDSWVSSMLPISDAFLGALGYLADVVSGVIGGRKRWKTMPWIVVVFGLLVGPLGGISVLLVIMQPVLFNAWCTLCLVTAVISLAMIGPAMDEFLASCQVLARARARGESMWTVFWKGEQGE